MTASSTGKCTKMTSLTNLIESRFSLNVTALTAVSTKTVTKWGSLL